MSATLEGRQNYAEFDEYIDYQLQKTRQGVKLTDVVTAACGVALLTVSYLLVFVVFDHWVIAGGFGYGMRVGLLSGLLAATLALIGWKVLLPWLRSVTRLYAAKSLEGISPELSSNLLNYVDLRDSGRAVSPTIIRSIEKRAAVTLSHTDVDDAVDRRLLLRLSYGLLAAVVVFSLYTVASPKDVWPSFVRLAAPWSDTGVSTETEFLSIQPGEDVEIVAGEYLDVSVDLRGAIPDGVTLSYTTDDHSFVDEVVDMHQSEEGLKQFRCTLSGRNGDGLLQSLSYRVTAGDAVSREFRVTVKQPPSASVTSIHYDFPDYMEFPDQSVDGPNIDAWEGTRITIEAETNVPVTRARIEFSDSEQFELHPVDMDMTIDEDDPKKLTATWQPVRKFLLGQAFPKFYRVQCRTEDGTSSPSPAIHEIRLKADQKPDLVAISPAETREVPSNAIIPFLAKASDPDFQLSSVVLKVQKGSRPPLEREIYSGTADRTKSIYDLKLDDLRLRLQNGDVLEWWIEAEDNRFVEGPDPRRPSINRVLLEANVAITPRLKLIIREPVDQQEAEEQHEFERDALEDKLDAADQQPNGAEPFNADENPPPDDRNANPEDQPRDNDPRNPEEQPTGDEDSDEPQDGGEQSGEGGQTGGESGENTADGSEGQTGTESGTTGTEDGDATGSEASEDGDGTGERRPLSTTGEDDQEVLRELLQRQSQEQDEGDNPQPNDPSNPNNTDESSTDDSSNPDSNPSDNTDETNSQPGNEGSPSDTPNPNGSDPASPENPDGASNEGTEPSNPDGTDSPESETNPDGTGTNPEGNDPEPGSDPNTPTGDESSDGNTGNNTDPTTTDPESGAGTPDDSSMPNDGQSPNEGGTGSESQPGEEPSDSESSTGQDGGSDGTSEADPGNPSNSGENEPGNPAEGNGSESENAQGGESSNSQEGNPGSEPNGGDPQSGNPSDSNEGQNNEGGQNSDSGSESSNQPGESGRQEGSSGSSGQSGESSSGSDSGSSESGSSGSSSNSDGGTGGESGSSSESGSGSSGSEGGQDGGSGTESSGSPDGQNPTDGGTSSSDSASETGSEESSGTGSSNETENQPNETGSGGNTDGGADGMPSDDGPEGGSSTESGSESSDGSSGDSGSASKSGGSESGESQQSGEGGQSGEGSDGPAGETGGTGSAQGGNPKEGNSPGPPSKTKNPGDGQRVARDPGELNPEDAVQADNAGGTAGNPDPAAPEKAPLEDRLKATNMVLKKLKEDMKRGEVDDQLLKKLGWTEQDMQRFVERMERNLAEPKPNDPREAARRRQFEESLKSLDLKNSGGERLDQMKNKRDTDNFSDRRLPVPRRYRQAYEDITRRLSRQQKGGSGK